MVHQLESRLQSAKDNVELIQKMMATWSKAPLFERVENKNSSLLNLSDRDERTKKRYDEIAGFGTKIHELLQVSTLSPSCRLLLLYSRAADIWVDCLIEFAFSALTLLVGRQEGHPACKN